jgi:hypothetical protein
MDRISFTNARRDRSSLCRYTIAPIAITLAALALAAPAFAQSSPDSADPSPAGYVMPVASTAAPANTGAYSADDSAERNSGWERAGEEYSGGDSSGEVLEIPQTVDRGGSGSSRGSDSAARNGDYPGDNIDVADVYLIPVPWQALYPNYGVGPYRPYRHHRAPTNPARRPAYPQRNPYPAPFPQYGNAPGRGSVGPPGPNSMNSRIGSPNPMMPPPSAASSQNQLWNSGP